MADNFGLDIQAGSTSISIPVLIRKTADNTEYTGLAYNTGGIVLSYQRQGAARSAITPATQTVTGAYSSGGFVEIDATNMPGLYRLDVPDAAFATGVDWVVVSVKFTNAYVFYERFNLSSVHLDQLVRATTPANTLDVAATGEVGLDFSNIKQATGGTTLSNITIPTVTGVTNAVVLPTGTGAGQISLSSGGVLLQGVTHTSAVIPTVTNVTNDMGITQAGADKVWTSATRTLTAFSTALALSIWDVLESAIATASSIGLKVKTNLDAAITSRLAPGGTLTTVTNLTNAPTAGDFTAAMKTSLNAATPASVTGAVGSVTADVGITQGGADKVWGSAARSLTTFGTLIADIWANVTRSLTDKAGFSLSVAPPTAAENATAVWGAGTKALTDKAGFSLAADQSGVTVGTVNALGTQAKADVNAEVVDTLDTDTLAELSQGIPAATPTIKAALMLLYMALRNKSTTTNTEFAVYNDAGTKIAKQTLTDAAGTFTVDEMVSGA